MTERSGLPTYPMTGYEQPPAAVERLRGFTESFISRFELFENLEPQASTIVSFAKHCTTPGVDGVIMEAACAYLALVLYVDDEDEGSRNKDRDSCLRRYQNILSGVGSVETLADQALMEWVLRVDAIAAGHGMSAKQVKYRATQMFRAQHYERAAIAAGATHGIRDFYDIRPRTIANDPWISLLKMAENVDERRLDPMMKSRFRVLEELANRFIFLLNDIFSAHREAEDPSALNLVCILHRMGDSWISSLGKAWDLHDRGVESFRRVKTEIVEECLPECYDEVRRYIDLLEINITGNRAAIAEIGSRYQVP